MKNNQSNDLFFQLHDFTNCRVVISNPDSGRVLADTTILEYRKKLQTIRVKSADLHSIDVKRAVLSIYAKDSIFKYLATVRKAVGTADLIELALYKGSDDNNREVSRYSLRLNAKVDALVLGDQVVTLRKPLDITLLNISRGGVLLQGLESSFHLNDTIRLIINANEFNSVLLCKVVRIKPYDTFNAQFGCSFVAQLDAEQVAQNNEAIKPDLGYDDTKQTLNAIDFFGSDTAPPTESANNSFTFPAENMPPDEPNSSSGSVFDVDFKFSSASSGTTSFDQDASSIFGGSSSSNAFNFDDEDDAGDTYEI